MKILEVRNKGKKKEKKQFAHAIKTLYRQGLRVCDAWF
jgi:regulator of replication initiation timing